MTAKLLLISSLLLLPSLACSQMVPTRVQLLSRPSAATRKAPTLSTTASVSEVEQLPTSTVLRMTTLTSTPPPSPTSVPTRTAPLVCSGIATDVLNVRSGPGTEHDVVQTLSRGYHLEITARDDTGIWLQVPMPEGGEGWVHSDYVVVTVADCVDDLEVADGLVGVIPSSTLGPSGTPLPTTQPTQLPSMTPSPTAGWSEETAHYVAEAKAVLESYESSFTDVEALAGAASDNLLIVLNKGWRSQVSDSLAALEAIGERVREMEPPPQFQENHQHLLLASQHFDVAADLAMEGIESLNSDKVEQAIAEGLQGRDALVRYAEEFEAYLK